MVRMTTLTMALIFSVTANSNAAVTIVDYSGVVPIADINNTQLAFDANSHQNYDVDEVKRQLFEKYHTVENMLLYSEKFSEAQKSVLRELTMQLIRQQNKQIFEQRRTAKIEAIQEQIDTDQKEHEAINDPKKIVERRQFNAKVTEAEKAPIYNSNIQIETIPYDPTGSKQITINNRVNRPSVISFFDTIGHAFTIDDYFPKDTTTFEIIKKGSNQLLVSAKVDFETLSGFVFLDNEPQAIPVLFTSDPKKNLDVKKNIILPSIAPTNKGDVEVSVVPLENLNKEDDPNMYRILHGLPNQAKPLKNKGLPKDSSVYAFEDFVYIRTRQEMKYDIYSAISIRGLYVYKARPRNSYWFIVDNKEVEVQVYE
ncbi:hypothetical protein F7U72_19330 [Vibrio vulnificus]|nr:hypothetical protein [Vibrio vulnificus]